MAETMGDRLLIRNIKVRSCCWCFFIECLPILLQISAGHFILNLVHAAAATAIHRTVQKYLPNELIIFILEMLDLPTAVTKRCVPACRAMVRVRVVTLWAVRSFLTSMNSNRMPHHMYTSIVACFNSACFCVFVCIGGLDRYAAVYVCTRACVHVCPRVRRTMNSVPFEEEEEEKKDKWMRAARIWNFRMCHKLSPFVGSVGCCCCCCCSQYNNKTVWNIIYTVTSGTGNWETHGPTRTNRSCNNVGLTD